MTQKHFVAIAATIKAERNSWVAVADAGNIARADGAVKAIDDLTRKLADQLATFNPEFDRTKFLRAAGVE